MQRWVRSSVYESQPNASTASPRGTPTAEFSGRHHAPVRRYGRILATARSLHDRRDTGRVAVEAPLARHARVREQLAGHASRDVLPSVSQRVSAELEMEHLRRS